MRKVGILVGRERSFPHALIERVAQRDAGVVVEWMKLGATSLDTLRDYTVLVDRISHEVPYYRLVLKHAQLAGIEVINNPFARLAEDKFTAAYLAQQHGVAVPKTVLLPNKEYIPDITPESLTNLEYPINWWAIVEYIGLPAVVKPAVGGGWKSVTIANSLEEILAAYDASGQQTMMVQEFIRWEKYVRCICIGRRDVLPIAWDPTRPHHERYLQNPNYLTPEQAETVVAQSLLLCQALGHDMNTVEFAIQDGVPYAIDFTNSAPDFDITSLGEWHFNWVVDRMADLVIEKALAGPHPPCTTYAEGFRG